MSGRFVTLLALALSSAAALPASAQAAPGKIDLTQACIEGQGQAHIAAEILAKRLAERGITAPECRYRIRFTEARGGDAKAEGFTITPASGAAHTVVVSAHRLRGLIYGAGWLLMHASPEGEHLTVSLPGKVSQNPAFALRGVQIGYRPKNNSFDAWTPQMLARRIEDLALMGANRIQLISPRSDDASSNDLQPVPPEQALADMAAATHRLDLDVALFQPVLGDAKTPAERADEVAKFRKVLALMPALDALYVPSGDPGHARPGNLIPAVAAMAKATRSRFPKAEVLVSTQGFDAADFRDYAALLKKRPKWLSAIFIGPQTRETLQEQQDLLGKLYPLELYPDTAHAMHAQYPVEKWRAAFALTEGREPVNPRPSATETIFENQSPGTRGFVVYSEGVNDDWNDFQWLQLGWNPAARAGDTALAYARAFIGTEAFAPIPAMLEANWEGDPAQNPSIPRTLAAIDALEVPGWSDWRIDLYRYRAVYDQLIALRWKAAQSRMAAVRYTLRQAPAIGASATVAAVSASLNQPESPEIAALHARLAGLAAQLWQKARMQKSVPLYGASNWERGANFDRALTPLDDSVYLKAEMAKAMALPGEAARRTALAGLGDPWDMAGLALYDDLGDPDAEPHLVRGVGFAQDPQLRHTAIDGVADNLPADGWRLAEVTYAEALYDQPLRLHYSGLRQGRSYRLRITLAGEGYYRAMQLTANGHLLYPYKPRTSNPMQVDVTVPSEIITNGTLDLAFSAKPGAGGSGRGQQVAETWLIPLPLTP